MFVMTTARKAAITRRINELIIAAISASPAVGDVGREQRLKDATSGMRILIGNLMAEAYAGGVNDGQAETWRQVDEDTTPDNE